jgi:hypothetical protein
MSRNTALWATGHGQSLRWRVMRTVRNKTYTKELESATPFS